MGESTRPLPSEHEQVSKLFPFCTSPEPFRRLLKSTSPTHPHLVLLLPSTILVLFLLQAAGSQTLGCHLRMIHIGHRQTQDDRLGQVRVWSPSVSQTQLPLYTIYFFK